VTGNSEQGAPTSFKIDKPFSAHYKENIIGVDRPGQGLKNLTVKRRYQNHKQVGSNSAERGKSKLGQGTGG